MRRSNYYELQLVYHKYRYGRIRYFEFLLYSIIVLLFATTIILVQKDEIGTTKT